MSFAEAGRAVMKEGEEVGVEEGEEGEEEEEEEEGEQARGRGRGEMSLGEESREEVGLPGTGGRGGT